MPNLPIILASSSPARVELLKQIRIIPSKILPADIDESELKQELPNHLASRLAHAKAMKISQQISDDAIIIGADTVVCSGRRVLPKALTVEDIRNCLTILSGRRHRVYTGVCILKKTSNDIQIRQKIAQTIVKFKRLTIQEIDFYCRIEEGLNKAGGCGISGYAQAFIPFISGSYSNVMGLPLFETSNMLASLGYEFHRQ